MSVERQLKLDLVYYLQEMSYRYAILERSPSAQGGDLDVAIAVPVQKGLVEFSRFLRQERFLLVNLKQYDTGAIQATFLAPMGGEVRVDFLYDPGGFQKYAISTTRFMEASSESEKSQLLTGYMLSKAHFKGRYLRFLALLRRPDGPLALREVKISRFFCFSSTNFLVFSFFSLVRRSNFRIRSIPRYLKRTFRPKLRFASERRRVVKSPEERHELLMNWLEELS